MSRLSASVHWDVLQLSVTLSKQMMDVFTHQRPAVIQFMLNKKLFLLEESDYYYLFLSVNPV